MPRPDGSILKSLDRPRRFGFGCLPFSGAKPSRKGLVYLGCVHAQPNKSAAPVFVKMPPATSANSRPSRKGK